MGRIGLPHQGDVKGVTLSVWAGPSWLGRRGCPAAPQRALDGRVGLCDRLLVLGHLGRLAAVQHGGSALVASDDWHALLNGQGSTQGSARLGGISIQNIKDNCSAC